MSKGVNFAKDYQKDSYNKRNFIEKIYKKEDYIYIYNVYIAIKILLATLKKHS